MTDPNVEMPRQDAGWISSLLRDLADQPGLTLRKRASAQSAHTYLEWLLAGQPPRAEPDDNRLDYAASTVAPDWEGATPDRPTGPEGYEHATGVDGTLCGIPASALTIWRHHWQRNTIQTCPDCSAADSTTRQ